MGSENRGLASLNVYLAQGNKTRQTNGMPDGGRTFSWVERVAKHARARRKGR